MGDLTPALPPTKGGSAFCAFSYFVLHFFNRPKETKQQHFSSLVVIELAVWVLLCECGEVLLSRDSHLGAIDQEVGQAGQQWERGHAATHLGVEEAEVLKLSEVLKKGQAATHLGVVEDEVLKPSEVLKEGQAATHLGAGEDEDLKLSEVLK